MKTRQSMYCLSVLYFVMFVLLTGVAYALPQAPDDPFAEIPQPLIGVLGTPDAFNSIQPLSSAPVQETSRTFSAPVELPPSVTTLDAQVPEPSSLVLTGVGLLLGSVLIGLRRRARRER